VSPMFDVVCVMLSMASILFSLRAQSPHLLRFTLGHAKLSAATQL
jgi:hypothetical protein